MREVERERERERESEGKKRGDNTGIPTFETSPLINFTKVPLKLVPLSRANKGKQEFSDTSEGET